MFAIDSSGMTAVDSALLLYVRAYQYSLGVCDNSTLFNIQYGAILPKFVMNFIAGGKRFSRGSFFIPASTYSAAFSSLI
jgi:hypothetical protein